MAFWALRPMVAAAKHAARRVRLFILLISFGIIVCKDTNKRAKNQIYLDFFEREYLRAKLKVKIIPETAKHFGN